jgi:hypothetical protein
MIRVSTVKGKVFEGEVFAVDPHSRSIALKTADGQYTIINPTHMAEISGNLEGMKAVDVARFGIR